MDRIKLLSISVILLLIINIFMIGFLMTNKGRHNKGSMKAHRKAPKNIIIQKLDFNQDQQDAYELLIHEHRPKIEGIQRSIAQDKNALYQLLKEDNQEAKDSLLNRLKNHQFDIELLHFNHFMDIKKLCNKDQLPKFESLSIKIGQLFHKKPPRR